MNSHLWFRPIQSTLYSPYLQYIPRNMHTVFALLCFVVVIHWLIFPYPSGLLHWHCGNLTIAPVPAKQPWWIWINTSCEFIMNDCITTTKQSTTKPCAYFLGYTLAACLTKGYHWVLARGDQCTICKSFYIYVYHNCKQRTVSFHWFWTRLLDTTLHITICTCIDINILGTFTAPTSQAID